MEEKKSSSWLRRFWNEWGKPFIVVVVIVSTLRSAIADWNDVPTGSMKPTILEGDRIFVNKLAYDLKVPFTTWRIASWSTPTRGDVIVCFSPHDETRLVKRVVGIPGDRIQLIDNQLFVNDKPAVYKPLDQETIDQINPDERPHFEFKAEDVEGRIHPVMTTPQAVSIRSFPELTVPEGEYFVMGDNRDQSFDSRYFGLVSMKRIVGRATGVAGSVDPENHYWPRWDRFFRSLP
jgi:signal peptidase I